MKRVSLAKLAECGLDETEDLPDLDSCRAKSCCWWNNSSLCGEKGELLAEEKESSKRFAFLREMKGELLTESAVRGKEDSDDFSEVES